MTKKYDQREPKKPYMEWLKDPIACRKIKDLLQTVGFPLEITTRNKLKNCGYSVSNSSYSQVDPTLGQSISREIDIYANKRIRTLSYQGCELIFDLTIIGECKYSSTDDFFGFQRESQLMNTSFPVIFYSSLFQPNPQANFKFPIIQNVSEVNTTNHTTSQNSIIYAACEQVFNAFSYFTDVRNSIKTWEEYLRIYRELNPKLDKYTNEKHPTGRLIRGTTILFSYEIIKDFVNSTLEKNELFSTIRQLRVHLGIPIIVVGPDNGLLKVEIKDEKVNDLTDSKYWAYLHTPRENKANPRSPIEDSWNFAVIICNANHVEECLSAIENGAGKTIQQILRKIKNDPALIFYDIYSQVLGSRY